MAYQSIKTGKQIDDVMVYLEGETEGADKGVKVVDGQFSVGTRENPYESVFGGGDSVALVVGSDYAFHCDIANTTGNVITGATDVTEIVSSDEGSFTGLFDGTTAGKYMLVGSDYPFYGFKISYESLATVEPENILAESYDTGAVWTASTFMTTNSDFPYQQYGWNVSQVTTEQILFGLDIQDPLGSGWEAQTLNINGQDITKYWGRLRITANITGDPEIQQLKVHTNRTEIEDTGFLRYYGFARTVRTIQSGINLSVKNDLFDPANRVVDYTSNYNADISDNRLNNGATDGFGYLIPIQNGLDTSTDLVLGIAYYVEGTDTGDIEFVIESTQVADGFVYNETYGDSVSETYTQFETISAPANLERKTATFTIPINRLSGNSGVVVNLRRIGGSPQDTLSDNVIITNVIVLGRIWHS